MIGWLDDCLVVGLVGWLWLLLSRLLRLSLFFGIEKVRKAKSRLLLFKQLCLLHGKTQHFAHPHL